MSNLNKPGALKVQPLDASLSATDSIAGGTSVAGVQASDATLLSTPSWLSAVNFDAQGLIPAIAQDFETGSILMVAWMNREALSLTVSTGHAVYWSRSRQKLWHKGEESGHTQLIKEIRLDCDADVILLKVEQLGGIACHTGRANCFFQVLNTQGHAPTWQTIDPVLKDPSTFYKK
jgi:phosphoribosyl-AMP cyclohydrolase